jgi:hypothetical protein
MEGVKFKKKKISFQKLMNIGKNCHKVNEPVSGIGDS